MVDLAQEVLQAETRIRPYIRETRLEPSPWLSEETGASVFLKLENLQHTSAFKVRGAMNKLLSMTEAELARGVVTASTGNHGTAVAYTLNRLGVRGLVFVPTTTPEAKVAGIERLGAEVRRFAEDNADTEAHARAHAEREGATYISPYNDPMVAAGQGTISVELARQLEKIDVVLVALGGGGLIAGMAAHLKAVRPKARIIGCSPENSQVMIQSVRAGEILDLPSLPTLSDSTAGGLEPGSITFPLCRDLVDEYLTVTEEEIRENLRAFMETEHLLIEGAAAVPLAALRGTGRRLAGKNVVVLICGANISMDRLKEIL